MEWIRIFKSSDEAAERLAENKPQLLIVNNKRICLIRHNQKYFAVQDRCTHNSESLSKGSVNFVGEIVCPLHGYRFDLQNGRESSERSAELETFPTKEDETGFYVGI